MKIYIICDLEGTAGADDFFKQCEFKGEVVVYADAAPGDAGAERGGGGRAGGRGNFPGGLDAELLHPACRLVMGAGDGGPVGLDGTCDALFMVGLHGMAFAERGVMAHSFATHIAGMWVNRQPFGEIGMNVHAAGEAGAPCVFLSGDLAAAREVEALAPGVETVAVKEGLGEWPGSGLSALQQGFSIVRSLQPYPTLSLSPERARQAIREGAERAVGKIGQVQPFCWKGPFTLRTRFIEVRHAERAAGARQGGRRIDETTSDLLDGERDSGRLRPVASPVDRDERDRVFSKLGGV